MGVICKGLLMSHLRRCEKHLLTPVAMAFASCCFPSVVLNMCHSFSLLPKNGSRITHGALSVWRNLAPLSLRLRMALAPLLVLLG